MTFESWFVQLFNRMTAQFLAFLWPWDLERTSRSLKLQKKGRVYHTKLKRNQSINVRIQANVKSFSNKNTKAGFSPLNIECMRWNKHEVHHTDTSQEYIKSHQNPFKLWEIIATEVLISCYQNVEFNKNQLLSQTDSQTSEWMSMFEFFFLTQSVKQQLFPCFNYLSLVLALWPPGEVKVSESSTKW